MNALFAAPLGIAAALVGAPADATATAQPVEEHLPPPVARPLTSDQPAPDLLAPELAEAATRLEESDPAKICDDKCKVIVFTEATLPHTGAADILSVVLEPEQHGLSIPNADGTPALTIRLEPTKIARGEGLVATAKF